MTINWNRRSYTQEQFIEAWMSSTSLRGVALKLGHNGSGSGYHTIRRAAISLGLNQEHMPKSRTDRTATSRRTSLTEILVENSSYNNTDRLKKRLYKENLLEEKCSSCGITEWLGKSAPLALDHINGVRSDNRIKNLRILCYNCHGQTDTFGSKNKVSRIGSAND